MRLLLPCAAHSHSFVFSAFSASLPPSVFLSQHHSSSSLSLSSLLHASHTSQRALCVSASLPSVHMHPVCLWGRSGRVICHRAESKYMFDNFFTAMMQFLLLVTTNKNSQVTWLSSFEQMIEKQTNTEQIISGNMQRAIQALFKSIGQTHLSKYLAICATRRAGDVGFGGK